MQQNISLHFSKIMFEELSVTHPSIESAKQAFNIASLVKDPKVILDYLTSLHRKLDKVATSPSIEIDTGDTLFRADDRSVIQRIKRKLGDLSADVTGIRNFLSFFGFKSSTTEGEKSSSQLNHPATVSDPPPMVSEPIVSDLPPVVSKPLVNQAVVPEPLIVDAVIEIQPQTNEPLVPVHWDN